jgi:hypothetical protein
VSTTLVLLLSLFINLGDCYGQEAPFQIAERNAILARQALQKSSEFLRKWTARKDKFTSLLRHTTV